MKIGITHYTLSRLASLACFVLRSKNTRRRVAHSVGSGKNMVLIIKSGWNKIKESHEKNLSFRL